MPSDAKKKQQQKKKEAAKARQSGKKPTNAGKSEDGKEESPAPGDAQNGINGTPLSAEGISKIHLWMLLHFKSFQFFRF